MLFRVSLRAKYQLLGLVDTRHALALGSFETSQQHGKHFNSREIFKRENSFLRAKVMLMEINVSNPKV